MITLTHHWNPSALSETMPMNTYKIFLIDFQSFCSPRPFSFEAFEVFADFYRPERCLQPETFQFLLEKSLKSGAHGLVDAMIKLWPIPLPYDEEEFVEKVVALLDLGSPESRQTLEKLKYLREHMMKNA